LRYPSPGRFAATLSRWERELLFQDRTNLFLHSTHRLFQIRDQILNIFDTHGDADKSVGDP